MPTPDRSPEGVPHQPALDGVRGLAIALVLCFHGGFSWMRGGYVGVSVFFTLSGFLITRLLLREHDRTGAISYRSFYVRRIRRLMPASLACLAAIAVAAGLGAFAGVTNLRRDILAALAQVANWNALAGGSSYADLIARAAGSVGPVDHFWSLSIEEQFYWVWPVAVAVLVRARSARGRARMLVVGAAIGVAAGPVVAAVWGPDAAYWATPARLGEILVGAALAALLELVVDDRPLARWWSWAGAAALGVVLWAACTWPSDGGPAYAGWLGLFALASAALILGVQVPGPLRAACAAAPAAHLGRISYGVYLYHWPIFALLPASRVGVGGGALFAVRMAVTLAVAEVSYRWLEQPLRTGHRNHHVPAFTVAGVGIVAVVTVAAVPAGAASFQASGDVPRAFVATSVAVPATTPSSVAPPPTEPPTGSTAVPETGTAPAAAVSTTPVPPTQVSASAGAGEPSRILLLGDSTGVALAEGLYGWATDHPDDVQVASLARLGCGLITDSAIVGDEGDRYRSLCRAAWDDELPALLADGAPDQVLIMVTLPDVLERVWEPSEGPMHARDPRYAARLRATYAERAQTLIDAGVRRVLWVIPPRPSDIWPQASINPVTDQDWAAFTAAVAAADAAHPEIDVLRLDEWMAAHEPVDDSWRPDGLHLTPPAARVVTEQFLAPRLLSP